jgi:hypothetical protein
VNDSINGGGRSLSGAFFLAREGGPEEGKNSRTLSSRIAEYLVLSSVGFAQIIRRSSWCPI